MFCKPNWRFRSIIHGGAPLDLDQAGGVMKMDTDWNKLISSVMLVRELELQKTVNLNFVGVIFWNDFCAFEEEARNSC